MNYYKTAHGYASSIGEMEGTPITQEEFDSHMAEINKRIEEEQANATPEPTPEDRISALEEIETQQDESIADLYDQLFSKEEVSE